MATFTGLITAALPETTGVSKAGNAWRRRDYVLTYDSSKPEYPKAITFSVMNDNIEKLNIQRGGEYEVEVDFAVREYQGRHYMSASCWQATAKYVPPTPAAAPKEPEDDFPF